MNSVTKTTPVRDLMLGSGVMLLVYGLAIAALISWFVLDSRKNDADVIEVASTDNAVADSTSVAADAAMEAQADVSVAEDTAVTDVDSAAAKVADEPVMSEGVALSDFVAVPASETDRENAVVNPIAVVSETQTDQGSESVQATALVPEPVAGQAVESTQGPRTTEAAVRAETVTATAGVPVSQSAGSETPTLARAQVSTQPAGDGEANAEVLVSSYDNRPVLTLTGRVINELQAPIAGLRVFVYHADNEGVSVASAVTNSGGDFHLPALEKAPYIVKTAFGDTISVFDFARSGSVDLHIVSQQGTEVATVSAESAPKAPDFQLASTVTGNAGAAGSEISVSGQVQSDLGAPLADVLVRYNGTTLMQTGIDGSYSISLQPGTASKVSIQYKKEGHLAEIRTITAQTWGKSNQLRQDVVMRSIKMQ